MNGLKPLRTPSRPSRRQGNLPDFRLSEIRPTNVPEASDVVALSNGSFLVVGDLDKKLHVLQANGARLSFRVDGLKGKESEFEGITYDEENKKLYLSREERREIAVFSFPTASEPPELLETITVGHLDVAKNKGIEGLAFLPSSRSFDGKSHLLAATEGKPLKLLIFSDKLNKKPLRVDLDDTLKGILKDVSAIAVHPESGNIYLASDESSRLAAISLSLNKEGDKVKARLVHAFEVKANGKALDRIEGLTFDAQGSLYLLTENDGLLRKYECC